MTIRSFVTIPSETDTRPGVNGPPAADAVRRPARPGGAVAYRGPNPRLRTAGWAALLVTAGFVLGATAPGAVQGLATLAAAHSDKLPWFGTRVTAFLAYLALGGAVVWGLLLSTKLLDVIAHRPVTFALHKDLSLAGLGLAAVHAILLALDSKVPFSIGAIVVPFAAPYRPAWVGLGQIAFIVTAIVFASFYVRGRMGQRTWRLLHYLTFAAFAAATVHGLRAGTDTAEPWAWAIYAGTTSIVVFLLVYRVVLSVSMRRARVRVPAPAAASS